MVLWGQALPGCRGWEGKDPCSHLSREGQLGRLSNTSLDTEILLSRSFWTVQIPVKIRGLFLVKTLKFLAMLDDISGSHMLLWFCPLYTLKSNFTVGVVFPVAAARPTREGHFMSSH